MEYPWCIDNLSFRWRGNHNHHHPRQKHYYAKPIYIFYFFMHVQCKTCWYITNTTQVRGILSLSSCWQERDTIIGKDDVKRFLCRTIYTNETGGIK